MHQVEECTDDEKIEEDPLEAPLETQHETSNFAPTTAQTNILNVQEINLNNSQIDQNYIDYFATP